MRRPWKGFTYGTSNSSADRSNGKLKTAIRHNFLDSLGLDFSVTETYTYAGKDGRVSIKVTTTSSADHYVQRFVYL